MKPELVVVTGNPLKFRELSHALSEFFVCVQKELSDYKEIQGTAEEILKHKVKAAYEKFKEPVLVDDTSVYLSDLGGFPGPYIRSFFEHMSPYDMGVKFAGSRIKIQCLLGMKFSEDEEIIVEGVIEGDVVTPREKDHQGREFDFFVKMDGTDTVMVDLSVEEKNKVSHRGKALKVLMEKLKNRP